MTIVLLTAAVALLGALIYLMLQKPSGRETPARRVSGGSRAVSDRSAVTQKTKPKAEVDTFRGAMIFPQKDACEAVMKLRGKTFEEARSPRIPVPGCERDKCDCQLHLVVGRRRGPRRINSDRRSDVRFKEDRRSGRDRRASAEMWKDDERR